MPSFCIDDTYRNETHWVGCECPECEGMTNLMMTRPAEALFDGDATRTQDLGPRQRPKNY